MICCFCKKNIATERHHKFPNTKANRKIYGRLLDEPFNCVPACNNCNGSHRNVIIWDEKTFIQEAIKNGYNIKAISKTMKVKERWSKNG